MLRKLRTKFAESPSAAASLNVAIFYFLQKAIQLGGNLLLARLLAPAVFGEMALINTLIIGLSLLSDVGISQAIIRHPDHKDRSFLDTMWTIQVIRGVLLFLTACILSFPAAVHYDSPRLSNLIPVAALVLIVQGFRSTAEPLAYRNLKVGTLLKGKIAAQLSNLLIASVAASVLNNVWALVAGIIVSSFVDVGCGMFFLDRQTHRWKLDREHLSGFYRFGGWIILSTAVTFLSGQGVSLVQGLYVDSTTLGMLAISGVLSWVFGELITKGLVSVGYPILVKGFHQGRCEFNYKLNQIQLLLVGIGGGGFFAIAFSSHWITAILYDSRYTLVGDYLGVLAVSGVFTIYSMCLSSAFQACGKVHIDFYIGLGFALLRMATVILTLKQYGIHEMLWGIVAVNVFQNLVALIIQSRILGKPNVLNIIVYVINTSVMISFWLKDWRSW